MSEFTIWSHALAFFFGALVSWVLAWLYHKEQNPEPITSINNPEISERIQGGQ